MSAKKTEALLDLDTLVERRKIAIDGVLYEILSPDELSIIESHRFGQWGKRIEALADSHDEQAEAELDEVIARAARKILVGVPDEVFERLPGAQRWAVIDLFTGLLLHTKLKVAGAMQMAMGQEPTLMPMGAAPIGARSFPGSSGFMAEHRATGWRTRLRRWFERT